MFDINKCCPALNKEVRVTTRFGDRRAIRDLGFPFGLRLLDCTHYMQNMYLSYFDVYEWEYVNEKDKQESLLTFSIDYRKIDKKGYDGRRIKAALLDEYEPFRLPPSRIFKLGKFFYLYRTKGLWWFRFFNKLGCSGKNSSIGRLLFSDRHPRKRRLKIGNWIIEFLK